jgi:hypothetical protein
MKTTVRFLRHGGVYRPMCDLFESLTRSAAFRSGPGQTFRTHRKFLRPTHRRDEPRPAIPQRGRGRDEHRCPPPAQIRTSGITAYGSSLGYERRSVHRDKDEECGDEESIARR